MSGHCPICGTPGCNGSCNEMRGLSVREQAKRINEEAIELIEGVMQKHTAAMLEAMKEKVAEQRERARALACELAASQAREEKLREELEKLVRFNSSNEYTEVLSAYIANGREALSQPTDDTALREYVKDIERSLDWYKRRVTFLQEWQSKMRDPERTIVCDIIANGLTMEEGGRYSLDKDTALRELITKAGEVMRERCIGVSQDEMDEQFVDSDPWYSARSCRDSIRDLPVVTLDDLKGEVK